MWFHLSVDSVRDGTEVPRDSPSNPFKFRKLYDNSRDNYTGAGGEFGVKDAGTGEGCEEHQGRRDLGDDHS